jgi:hypothetical protein
VILRFFQVYLLTPLVLPFESKRKQAFGSLWSISGKYEDVLQQVLRHLVFTKTNQKTSFSYADILAYSELNRGSFNSLTTLNTILGPSRKAPTSLEFNEGLHFLLKKAFSLDSSLLVDWSKTMSLEDAPLTQMEHLTPEEARWVYCLSQLHEHWLPLSRILFRMEADLKAPLSIAQALILIKDQIILAQSTASQKTETGQPEMAFLEWLLGKQRSRIA